MLKYWSTTFLKVCCCLQWMVAAILLVFFSHFFVTWNPVISLSFCQALISWNFSPFFLAPSQRSRNNNVQPDTAAEYSVKSNSNVLHNTKRPAAKQFDVQLNFNNNLDGEEESASMRVKQSNVHAATTNLYHKRAPWRTRDYQHDLGG